MPSSAQRGHQELHWGIVGLGNIANDFVLAMAHCRHPNKVVAVSTSNSVERARAFKEKVGLGVDVKEYGNYKELMSDINVDIFYIATLNNTHFPLIISALEHGKSVLCEKPMVYSESEVETIEIVQRFINQRDGKNLFVMEAYWSRFFPAWQRIREIVRNGRMGEVLVVSADFSAKLPASRRQTSMGMTPLMDIGCYTIMFATFVFEGKKIRDVRVYGETDVDALDNWSHLVIHFDGGGYALCHSNSSVETMSAASVTLDKGQLVLSERFWAPTELRQCGDFPIGRNIEARIEHFPLPERNAGVTVPAGSHFKFHKSCGLSYEADHVWECLDQDKRETESHFMNLNESRKIASILEEATRQLGVTITRQPEDMPDLAQYKIN